MRRSTAVLISLAALGAACGSPPRVGLRTLYTARAMEPTRRNPVILVPGALGSRLVDQATGQEVWGAFLGPAVDPTSPEGARTMALPMRRGAPLAALTDTVAATEVLDTAKLNLPFGLVYEADAYLRILGALGVAGYRDPGARRDLAYEDHFTCFSFAYDWRRDTAEIAAELARFVEAKRAYVIAARRAAGLPEIDVKFDIVTHSAGSVPVRYFLRYGGADLPETGAPEVTWAGAAHVARVISIGPPNGGSVQTLARLARDGFRVGPIARYPPALSGTQPFVYQLLPRARHGGLRGADGAPRDPYDPALWRRHGWGLLRPDQAEVLAWLLPEVADPEARRAIAADHQAKCLRRAARIAEALDQPTPPPPAGLDQFAFLGDSRPTPAVLEIDPSSGDLRVAETAPGDGTVTRRSGLLDERSPGDPMGPLRSPVPYSHVTFLHSEHLELTKDPELLDNLLYLLLEHPRR